MSPLWVLLKCKSLWFRWRCTTPTQFSGSKKNSLLSFSFLLLNKWETLSLSFLLISLSHLNTDGSHFHTYKSVEITFTFSLSHRCTKEITPIPSHFQFNTFTQVSQRSCLSLLQSFAFTLYHPGGPMKIHTFTSSLSYFQIITFSILNFHFPTFTLSHFYPGEPIKLAHFHNFTLSHC